jgi:hypothetical protein
MKHVDNKTFIRLKLKASIESSRINRQNFKLASDTLSNFEKQRDKAKGERKIYLNLLIESINIKLDEKINNMSQEGGGQLGGGIDGGGGGFHSSD